jgi:hypothetical protein
MVVSTIPTMALHGMIQVQLYLHPLFRVSPGTVRCGSQEAVALIK